ncbi:hypothetical protein D922_02956 [Enterococcus faecalis 06-MB-DW-09]|nr:hypothetical protein D922_02956 [Enterococcus faecalis 06-MB-DW-09]
MKVVQKVRNKTNVYVRRTSSLRGLKNFLFVPRRAACFFL